MFRNRMLRYIVKRLLLLVPVLLGVSFVSFSLISLAPGNAATYMLGDQASPEMIAQLERELNLDQGFFAQFLLWISAALRGDFGTSFVTRIPIATLIWERLSLTFELASIAIVLTLIIAIPLGVSAAAWRDRAPDHIARLVAVAGISIPDFWSGIVLIFLLGAQLHWVSPGGFTPISDGLVPHLRSVILPAAILAFVNLALVTRMLRASMLETLSQNFIQAARSFGVSERELIWRDALKNAFIPTLTVIGLTVGVMLSGAVMLETVFSLPGLGKLLVDAVFQRDIPVLQAVLTLIGCVYVLVNLLVDIGYSILDPRIRY